MPSRHSTYARSARRAANFPDLIGASGRTKCTARSHFPKHHWRAWTDVQYAQTRMDAENSTLGISSAPGNPMKTY